MLSFNCSTTKQVLGVTVFYILTCGDDYGRVYWMNLLDYTP
jgi:hypothetical protein